MWGGRSVSGVNLRIDDEANGLIPNSNAVTSGTYRVTNDFDNYGNDLFDLPAPSGPYGNSLSEFDMTDANGTWSLYVRDDSTRDVGLISGGWSLNIETSKLAKCHLSSISRFHQ